MYRIDTYTTSMYISLFIVDHSVVLASIWNIFENTSPLQSHFMMLIPFIPLCVQYNSSNPETDTPKILLLQQLWKKVPSPEFSTSVSLHQLLCYLLTSCFLLHQL